VLSRRQCDWIDGWRIDRWWRIDDWWTRGIRGWRFLENIGIGGSSARERDHDRREECAAREQHVRV